MGILRNHYSLILRVEPASEDLDSGPVRLRPADGEGIDDGAQRMFGFGYLEQMGAGSVLFQVIHNFGDGVWAVFAEHQITDDAVHALGLDHIAMVPPFLRARVVAEPPEGSEITPTFRAAFALACSAPFRAEPAPRGGRARRVLQPVRQRWRERLMKIAVNEHGALRLLNWLAQENAVLVRAQHQLPLLLDSRGVYRRETDETWCDYLNMLAQGPEDCDGLAASRAGELPAKGAAAMRPGNAGYDAARRLGAASLPAEVLLTTRSSVDQPGLYHCTVRYRVGRTRHRDDPSARLGMNGGRIDPLVKVRWAARAYARTRPERAWRAA